MALGASSPPVAAVALFVNATAGQGGPPTATATLLIAGGLGFAASSALVILLLNVGRPATALSLGMLALILGASALEPATLQALRRNAENSHLPVPVTPLPAAAGIIAIWLSLPHVTDTKGCRLNRPRIQSERPTCELSVVDGSGADHLRIVWKPTPPPGRLNG